MTPKPTKITVDLGANSYPILIGAGLLADLPLHIKPYLQRKRLAVITDENVARHHLPSLQSIAQNAGLELATLTLPAGETTKSWAMLEKTCTWLLDQKIERGDLIVAFGGGVIGDLAGFAAAIVRRGLLLSKSRQLCWRRWIARLAVRRHQHRAWEKPDWRV